MKKLSVMQTFAVVVVLAATLCSAAFGIYVRSSYTEDIQNLPDDPDTVTMLGGVYKLPERNFEAIRDADLVVRAKAADRGIISMENTQVTMEALHVYRGDLNDGDEFILWTDVFFLSRGIPTIFTGTASNMIIPDREYIVFANRKNTGGVYEKYINKTSLLPEYISPAALAETIEEARNMSSCFYFQIGETTVGIISDPFSGNYTPYSEVSDCEILCLSPDAAEQYENLKSRIMQKIEEDFD